MSKIKYLLVGMILIAALLTTGSLCIADLENNNQDSSGPELEVTTDKKVYSIGEPVAIFLTNIGDEVLSAGGPIVTIYNKDNEIVYQDACYCWWELEPEEYIEWPPWDQTDRQGEQVPVGRYVVEGILYGDEEYIDTVTFYIINWPALTAERITIPP